MNITRNLNSSNKKTGNRNEEYNIKQLFDIRTLDFYCRYIISENENIKSSSLNLVKDLFNRISPENYGSDIERINRIIFVKRGLEARIKKKLSDREMIIEYINGGPLDKQLLDTTGYKEISDEELAYLNDQANELVKSCFVDEDYEQIIALSTDLKNANYSRRDEVVHKIQNYVSDLNMKFKKSDSRVTRSDEFMLEPGIFEDQLKDIYADATNPSRYLKTGITGLNMMLDGGFQSSRVYLFFGVAAAGKSMTMIDIAMQLKKYNKDYKVHDKTKQPCIVILTMENSTGETSGRMFGMISGTEYKDYSYEDCVKTYYESGIISSDDSPIRILVKYKPNLSVDTDYLYTMTEELNDRGYEVICVIQDHIKRIRPVNRRGGDLRLELGEIVNEFKAFANEMDIPVISVSHLNREAARTLDDKGAKNEKDLVRSLGSYNVSESNLMIDNCDVGIILNKEYDSNNLLHMGFSQIKTRTKCTMDLFFQPFVIGNDIKMVEDLNDIQPAYRRTLKDETTAVIRLRSAKQNDYADRIERSDDDDFFSKEVMGAVSENPSDTLLMPFNENQSSFTIVGKPSEPIFPIPIQDDIVFGNSFSAWEEELINRKYCTDARTIVTFFDDNGLPINDGVENLG